MVPQEYYDILKNKYGIKKETITKLRKLYGFYNPTIDSFQEFINSFHWESTPQGFKFWEAIAYKKAPVPLKYSDYDIFLTYSNMILLPGMDFIPQVDLFNSVKKTILKPGETYTIPYSSYVRTFFEKLGCKTVVDHKASLMQQFFPNDSPKSLPPSTNEEAEVLIANNRVFEDYSNVTSKPTTEPKPEPLHPMWSKYDF